jgi:hypothetical protein
MKYFASELYQCIGQSLNYDSVWTKFRRPAAQIVGKYGSEPGLLHFDRKVSQLNNGFASPVGF